MISLQLTQAAINNNSDEKFLSSVKIVAKVLLDGGVILLPTETVYGLMTLWDNQAGRERIFELKNRPSSKLLQMLSPDLIMAKKEGIIIDKRLQILNDIFFPGELTVICPAANSATIGLRIPQNEFLQALLKILGKPLAATSANLSGNPPACSANSAISQLCHLPDLILEGGTTTSHASTVISIVDAEMQFIREGAISFESIKSLVTTKGNNRV